MAKESSKVNYEKRPIPSAPGAKQIVIVGQDINKGTHPIPNKYGVPGSSKK